MVYVELPEALALAAKNLSKEAFENVEELAFSLIEGAWLRLESASEESVAFVVGFEGEPDRLVEIFDDGTFEFEGVEFVDADSLVCGFEDLAD